MTLLLAAATVILAAAQIAYYISKRPAYQVCGIDAIAMALYGIYAYQRHLWLWFAAVALIGAGTAWYWWRGGGRADVRRLLRRPPADGTEEH